MTLEEKYVILFQKECFELSKIVLTSLKQLSINPKNSNAIEKMLQASDTIIGDSRFINHNELEQAAMLLIKTFNYNDDMTQKSKEIEFFIDVFSKIIKS